MEDDLQSAGLSRERVALFVGPRCLLRPDPPPLFRVTNTPPLKLHRLWAQRSMRRVDGGGSGDDRPRREAARRCCVATDAGYATATGRPTTTTTDRRPTNRPTGAGDDYARAPALAHLEPVVGNTPPANFVTGATEVVALASTYNSETYNCVSRYGGVLGM